MIDMKERGTCITQIMTKFNIGKSTIYDILSRKEVVEKEVCELGNALSKKMFRIRRGDTPELDEAVMEWFCNIRAKKKPVSGLLLQQKALVFSKMIIHEIESKESMQNGMNLALCNKLRRFTASNGWLQGFKHRHHLKSYSTCGDSGEVELGSVILSRERVTKVAAKYAPADIYNCDETALFWKCIPERTLERIGSSTLQGRKQPKDRVTVLLCCNLTGSDMRKPLVIGKFWTPRCFKGIDRNILGVDYRANASAWMTGALFSQWLCTFDKSLHRGILLIMDGAACHQIPTGLKHIEVVFLEPNTTAVCQPLDQGIIQMLKVSYRKRLLEHIVDGVEHIEKDPGAIDLKQTVMWLSTIWSTFKHAPAIRKCFQKSSIFPIHFFEKTTHQDSVPEDTFDQRMTDILALADVDLVDYFNFDTDHRTENIEASDDEIVLNTLSSKNSISDNVDAPEHEEEEQVNLSELIQHFQNGVKFIEKHASQFDICSQQILQFEGLLKKLQRGHLSQLESSLKQTKISTFFSAS